MASVADQLKITRMERALRGGYWLGFSAADADVFDGFVARLKRLSASHRKWVPEERAWWLSDDAVKVLVWETPELKPMVDAAKVETRKQRTERRTDEQRFQEQRRREEAERRFRAEADRYAREQQSSSASSVPTTVSGAFTLLYLLPSAPMPVVKAAYRALAKTAHPDAGGSTERMKALNAACDLAEKWAAQHNKA